MSAFIAVRQPDAIHLFTDGAIYDDEGVLMDIASKVRTLPNMAAAMTQRGEMAILDIFLAGVAPEVASFDELVDTFDDALAAAQPVIARVVRNPACYELVLAGWSESRQRPEIYIATGHGEQGFEAGKLHSIELAVDAFIGAPPPADQSCLDWPDGFDARRDGLAILEAQRRTGGRVNRLSAGSAEGYGVGGFAMHTAIRPDRVDWELLRVWPDRIGEKIDPFAQDVVLEAAAA